MSIKRWALGAGGLAVAVALSSCTSSHPGSAPATSGSSVTPTSAAASTTSAPSSASSVSATTGPASSTSSAPSGPARCATASLSGSLSNPNGAAGSVYYTLMLVNHGSTDCVLRGWPGVSFVTGPNGTQVGAAATHNAVSAPAVTLHPGASAGASLQITEATNYGSGCGVTTVAGLRVYPPNQTDALYIAHSDRACTNTNDVTLHVGTFQAAP